MRYDIYLSSSIAGGNGPLNQRLCRALEKHGFSVFLPQRDVDQKSSPEEIARADFEALRDSRLVLALFRNASRNFFIELGFAHGAGKRIVAIISPDDSLDIMTRAIDLHQLRVTDAESDQQYSGKLFEILSEQLRRSPAGLNVRLDVNSVDWPALAEVYERAPLGKRDPEQLRRSFQSSFLTCIIQDGDKPVAAGRAISDGEYYINIYDVAVLPEYQGKGLGKIVVQSLLDRSKNRFILLTTTIGKENFYRKFGFRKHKTAMAIYPPSKQEKAKLYLEAE